ncbi:MAG TPA: hypothetical protein VK550_23675 [Polyangiaceae bacterium]|nr:hypothetical protein [Polyangiaceae bacterium]
MTILHASDLDASSRSDLIARAEALGIDKADVLTRAELVDEIVKRMVADPIERRLARGLLGVARDLVARVVERGLHLPDAAALIRGLQHVTLTPVTPPIATVTLADIYAGQGHRGRALAVLDEVLATEPEHVAARKLREKIAALPTDLAPTVAPSHAPPDASGPPQPSPANDDEPDHDHEPDRDHDREPEPDRDDEVRERDTLPPEADHSPTLLSTDLPLSTWRADPPEAAIATSRSTAIKAPFGARDADQLALVLVDETSVVTRWELGARALDDARARAQGGELTLRIVAVTPSWDGPKVEIRDVEVTLPVGDWWVCDLPAGAVLRAAIGCRGQRGFDPLAVALDVAALRDGEAPSRDASSLYDAGAAADRAGIEERARRRAQQGRPAEGRALSSWRTLALAPWEEPSEQTLETTLAAR